MAIGVPIGERPLSKRCGEPTNVLLWMLAPWCPCDIVFRRPVPLSKVLSSCILMRLRKRRESDGRLEIGVVHRGEQ